MHAPTEKAAERLQPRDCWNATTFISGWIFCAASLTSDVFMDWANPWVVPSCCNRLRPMRSFAAWLRNLHSALSARLRPLVESAFLRARWKYGFDMQPVSPESAVANSRVPVLLIHGAIDSNIPVRHSRHIHQLNRATELWEVPGADHCGAMAAAPEEFDRRVLNWFARSPTVAEVGTGVLR
jgi:pimeloyl-ACP methyl ester carboxylesterase